MVRLGSDHIVIPWAMFMQLLADQATLHQVRSQPDGGETPPDGGDDELADLEASMTEVRRAILRDEPLTADELARLTNDGANPQPSDG